MGIYVNRILNLKKIRAIGFDMDHTLVRYHFKNFELLAYQEVIKKLITLKNYPEAIKQLKFEFDRAVRGLVIDKKNGNLIKLNLYGRIKSSSHGLGPLDYETQKSLYQGHHVDLSDPNYVTNDTAFSLSHFCLYAQLVDLLDKGTLKLTTGQEPTYESIASDLEEMLNIAHRDGSLKDEVRKNIAHYIVQDPQTVYVLERFKAYGKKLIIITNSDYSYTKPLLEYAIDPFLKNHKSWKELFDITITNSKKPRYFMEESPCQKICPDTGKAENFQGTLTPGIYQEGWAKHLEKSLQLDPEDILYLGDHIYGDILRLKKACQWRTALVVEELEQEVEAYQRARPIQQQINEFMKMKEKYEQDLNELYVKEYETKTRPEKKEFEKIYAQIEGIDEKLSDLIIDYQKHFNPYWGEFMRAGQEQSRLGAQVEKYACIYMSKISDFYKYSPRTYFRPRMRQLPHEFEL